MLLFLFVTIVILFSCNNQLTDKKETPKVATLTKGINAQYLTHFKPEVTGIHGSRALWQSTDGNEGYWKAFRGFLLQ